MKLKYNLQFFADDDNDNDSNDNDTDVNSGNEETDITALAELISDKDKQIQQLEQDIADLRKSNANLLVKVNAMANPPEQKKSFEENLLSMVGAKPRKE